MKDEGRTLTEAELARKERFEATRSALEAEGYRCHSLLISVLAANAYALVLALPLVVIAGFAFFSLHPFGSGSIDALGFVLVFGLFFVLIVVHELIHGLTWGLFAKSRWKSVSFGVIWKYLTPYCTCDEPLPRHAYFIGALAPTVVLGIVPVLVALATGSLMWFGVGALMIIGGGGDLAITLKLLRFKPAGTDVLYLDHPYECGLVAFVR